MALRFDRVAPWLSAVLVTLWATHPHPAWLVTAALVALAAARPGARRTRREAAGLLAVMAAVVLGLWAEGRDASLARDFDTYWAEREAEVFESLLDELTALVDRGVAADSTLAALDSGGKLPSFEEVSRLRRASGLAALALYDASGELRVWDGVHRGRMPESVQAGLRPYEFGELPLASYLYVTSPTAAAGTVVAAALLRTDLPTGAGRDGNEVAPVGRETGERIRVLAPGRPHDGEVFDFPWEDEVLFSLALDRPAEGVRRAELLSRFRLIVALLGVLSWLLLASGAPMGPGRGRPAALAALALAVVLPIDVVPGLATLTSPADVLLPGPGTITLARWVVLLVALALGVGVSRPHLWPGGRPWLGALFVGVLVPLSARALGGGASAGFLAGPEPGWIVYTLSLVLFFALLFWCGLVLARRDGPRRARVSMGVAATVVLALVAMGVAAKSPGVPPLWLAAFALPLVLLRPAGPRADGQGAPFAWILALLLGASVALPLAWGARIEARMALAEDQVERLGTDVDPFLQFLLERMAATVDSIDATGGDAVELLYQGWRRSGLAAAGYPVWLTVWSAADAPQEELRVGFRALDRPSVAVENLAAARAADTVLVLRFDRADAHYLATVPLEDGRIVSGVVPPLRGAASASLLGPLFGSPGPADGDGLTLIPLLGDDPVQLADTLVWTSAGTGWRGELAAHYPDASYHAHYEVSLPGMMVTLARGTLLLALGLGVGGLLWLAGRVFGRREGQRRGLAVLAPTSFRARVTLALFGFFLLSNLIFGSLAYRTIAGASQRTALVLSERAVNDAAATYLEVGGEMHLLSRRVGADLLEYREGELREGSVDELVELGLYEAWVPFEVQSVLSAHESLLESAVTDLGDWEYVTAYRRLPDGDVLGAPVPTQAGAAAVRSREIAHLLGFAVLAGAALSLVLALLVARTLTSPIQTLRVAAERVGSGNLGVRLSGHRVDEFGAVFEAFNRMVRRLRGARRDLVRTTRRTQAIVEDAATGVVAFDADGFVTLVNPRARELLALDIEEGQRLSEADEVGGEFVRWIDLYFRDGLRETSTEFQSGEQRIRARARRITHSGPLAGAVVSLEDVTDELRTERILAWGEMARQVAHEVKNPLTPIKLSVQHIRRAWEDRSADFDGILTRNAEAMLGEIDRLAAIAAGFSRFGAPRAAGEQPLGPVALHEVVAEVMALYASGEGPIQFLSEVPDDLPRVAARSAEVKEVLVNLLENARAAIQESGTVLIRGQSEGGDVVLAVWDDGSGIAEEMLPRIFEPHFSTRSTGTGLGLAIVQRLVDTWGASVSVDSEVGRGTTVTLRFPV